MVGIGKGDVSVRNLYGGEGRWAATRWIRIKCRHGTWIDPHLFEEDELTIVERDGITKIQTAF